MSLLHPETLSDRIPRLNPFPSPFRRESPCTSTLVTGSVGCVPNKVVGGLSRGTEVRTGRLEKSRNRCYHKKGRNFGMSVNGKKHMD